MDYNTEINNHEYKKYSNELHLHSEKFTQRILLVIVLITVIIILLGWLMISFIISQQNNPDILIQDTVLEQADEMVNQYTPPFLKSGALIPFTTEQEIREFVSLKQYEIGQTDSYLKSLQTNDEFSVKKDLPHVINYNPLTTDQSSYITIGDEQWYGRLDANQNEVILTQQEEKKQYISTGNIQKFLVVDNYLFILSSADEFYNSAEYVQYIRKQPYSQIDIYDISKDSNNSRVGTYLLEGNILNFYRIGKQLHFQTRNSTFEYNAAEPVLPRFLKNEKLFSASNVLAYGFDVSYHQMDVVSNYTMKLNDIFEPEILVEHFYVNGDERLHFTPAQMYIGINTEFNEDFLYTSSAFELLQPVLPHEYKQQAQEVLSTKQYILNSSEKDEKLRLILMNYLLTLDRNERLSFLESIDQKVADYIAQQQDSIQQSQLFVHQIYRDTNQVTLKNYNLAGNILYHESIGTVESSGGSGYLPVIFTQLNNEVKPYIIINSTLQNVTDLNTSNVGTRLRFSGQGVYQFTQDNNELKLDLYAYEQDMKQLVKVPQQNIPAFDVIFVTNTSYDIALKLNQETDANGVVQSQEYQVVQKMREDGKILADVTLPRNKVPYQNNVFNGYYLADSFMILPVYELLIDGSYQNSLLVITYEDNNFAQELEIVKEIELSRTQQLENISMMKSEVNTIRIGTSSANYSLDLSNFSLNKE